MHRPPAQTAGATHNQLQLIVEAVDEYKRALVQLVAAGLIEGGLVQQSTQLVWYLSHCEVHAPL